MTDTRDDQVDGAARIRRLAPLLGLLAAGCCCCPRPGPWPEPESATFAAPEYLLEDQDRKAIASKDLQGQVVVVIAASNSHGREMPSWEDPVMQRYKGRIALLRLMELSSLPSFTRSFALGRIRQEMKGDQLAIDWDGKVFDAFRFNPDRVNVAVVDRKGMVVARASGVPDDKERDRILAAIGAAVEGK